jgi:hypothetical protein
MGGMMLARLAEAVIRFAAVFVGFFVFEANLLHASTGKEFAGAAVAALPLAIEKFLYSSHGGVSTPPAS